MMNYKLKTYMLKYFKQSYKINKSTEEFKIHTLNLIEQREHQLLHTYSLSKNSSKRKSIS